MNRPEEIQACRAMLQGMLFGQMLKDKDSYPLKIRDLQQEVDQDGNYLPYFIVVTESGIRLRIAVIADDIAEHDALKESYGKCVLPDCPLC